MATTTDSIRLVYARPYAHRERHSPAHVSAQHLMPKVTVTVDPALCIGAASCVEMAPKHFVLNDENQAVILTRAGRERSCTLEVTEGERTQLLTAAQSCPTVAIGVTDVP